MSTRSVTVIQFQYTDTSIALYRHCDGYLAVAGAALVEAIQGAACPEQVAGRLLCMTYDRESDPRLKSVYHVTTSADDHGDADHVYTAWLSPDGWRVRHSVRLLFPGWPEFCPNASDTAPVSAWPSTVYTVPDFAAGVNDDRQRFNQRLTARQKTEPYMAEAQPLELIAVG